MKKLVALCSLATAAYAEPNTLEVGAALGGHAFSANSELGVDDVSDLPGPASSVAIGARAAYFVLPRVAVEGEALAIPTRDGGAGDSALAFGLRAHARVDFGRGRLRPFVLAGLGVHVLRPSSPQMSSDTDQSYHWGGGVRWALGGALDLRLDARHLIVPDRTFDGATSEYELTAGISYRFGAARAPVHVEPTTPLLAADAPDRDLDTIPDAIDKCPLEPEDIDGFEDEDGCPELDNDGDQVPDADDLCPTEKETHNGYRDDDGCPDQVLDQLASISFAAGSAALDERANAVVARAHELLTELPEISLEIAGYASANEGSREHVMALSLRRAEAVKEALVARGIEASRILTVGHGADNPRGGPARSRRVEFRTLTANEMPL